MSYGTRFKEIRESLGLTQQQFDKDLKLKQDKTKNIETEKHKISIELAELIEQKYSYSGWWLLTGQGKKSKQYNYAYENESSIVAQPEPKYGIEESNIIKIPKLSQKVSAGYNIQSIDCVEQIGELVLDLSIFKTPPKNKLFAMQVDGYSMIPMIFPDSWVVFDDNKEFRGDGLYVINWDDCLMVKQICATPKKGTIQINSANKDYKSWEIDLSDTQCSFIIFGKVIRTIL